MTFINLPQFKFSPERVPSAFTLPGSLLIVALWAMSYVPAAGQGRRSVKSFFQAATTCVTPADRAWIDRSIQAYEGGKQLQGAGVANGPTAFPFYPLGGTMGREMWIGNLFDLDPTTGVLTYDCKASAYDGHDGHDSQHGRRPCERKAAGIPVFAALDGVVVTTRDGNYDDYGCSVPLGNNDTPANAVVIDHGNTQYTTYLHLRNGSVMVAPGQTVRAGQQIGLVGSSGKSTAPHLHLETKFNGIKYETFPGDCNNVQSGWENLEMPTGLRLTEAYIADNGVPRGQWVQGTRAVGSRFTIVNRPPNSSIEFRFIRPNGSASVHPVVNWNNAAFSNVTLWNYAWNVNLNMLGTWTLHLVVNGEDLAALPFEVVAPDTEIANRPPLQVQAAFDPVRPQPDRALFSRLQSSHLLVDPDYDLVKYRYEWTVNGAAVRNLVSAGQADALPAGSFEYGDEVACRITPIDELESEGAPIVVTKGVGGSISGQVTAYGQPLEGTTVRAGALEAITGPDGSYAIEGVAPAAYQLTAEKAGYDLSPKVLNVTAAPDVANANFVATWPAPRNLTATLLSTLHVRLKWEDPLTGESAFRIERRIGTGPWSDLGSVGANTVTHVDLTVQPGTQYSYRVRARIGTQHTIFSNLASVFTAIPAVPTGFLAKTLSATQIKLTWNDVSAFESEYRLERRTNASSTWAETNVFAPNTRAYTDENLTPEVLYFYRLRCSNTGAHSDYASSEAATWPVPPIPGGITAQTQAGGEIKIAWLDLTPYETGFRIERRTSSTSWVEVKAAGPNVKVFLDTAVDGLVQYFYRVRAVSGSRFSAYTSQVFATAGIPPAPADPYAVALSATDIKIGWRDTSTVQNPFTIERRTGTTSWRKVVEVAHNITSYVDPNLTPAMQYFYRVRCSNGSAVSQYSPEVNAITWAAPKAPTNFQGVLNGSNQPRLSWTDINSTATGYRLERRVALTTTWTEYASLGAGTRAFTDAGASPATRYEYRLRAVSGSRFSAYTSPLVTVSVP